MLKKLFIIGLAVLIVGVATIPMWTTQIADSAFKKPNLPDAAEMVDKAIRYKMYLYLYSDARRIAEKAIIYFPESSFYPGYIYSAALCAEKEKEYDAAIYWYTYFLERFPEHTVATQAKNALEKIKGIHK